MLVHVRKTLTVACKRCNTTLAIPVRSEQYESEKKPSNLHWFFDWRTADSFGWQEHLKDELLYNQGKTFEVNWGGAPMPYPEKSIRYRDGILLLTPPFGKSAFWVCGSCLSKPLKFTDRESLAHLGR